MTPDESTDSVRVAAGDLADWLRDWRLTYCEHWIRGDSEPCCAPCLRDRILASDWLADVVAQAKAEALREAAEELGRLWVKKGKHFADGIYSPGYERWLRARADREATR